VRLAMPAGPAKSLGESRLTSTAHPRRAAIPRFDADDRIIASFANFASARESKFLSLSLWFGYIVWLPKVKLLGRRWSARW
jgi:hypothetical protein